MVYTIAQRNIIQDRLIETVKQQVKLYSSRNLSLGGRATVMNTLIMTKIWYCLRLLNPTQAFFKKITSIMYQYVWQQKRPFVSCNQLSLPKKKGGLGMLQPAYQHRVLQIRNLQFFFHSNTTNTSLVQPLLKHHLSIISPPSVPAEMSFFVPEWRKHDLNHPTSIIHACYQAFDHFQITFDFSQCSLPMLLQLPLHYLFESYPDDHWLHHHRTFPAHLFFILDTVLKRLRIQEPHEYTKKPLLCRRLKQDILINRTVKLQSFMYQYIVNDVHTSPTEELSASSLVLQLKQSPKWFKYFPQEYRISEIIDTVKLFDSFFAAAFTFFWSLPLLLQARSHWYQLISRKLPIAPYLSQIGQLTDGQCRLCHNEEESLDHFVLTCPRKESIWKLALLYHYPTFDFSNDDILNSLYKLQSPFTTRSNLYRPFFVVVSTINYYIWYYYWQQIIHDIPFDYDVIITTINSQLSILLKTDNHYD